MMKVRIR